MKVLCRAVLAALTGSALFAGAAWGGTYSGMHPLQSDRLFFGAGGFFSDIDGNYQLDDPDGDNGTEVSLSDLGLDDSETLPAVALVFRLSERHRLQGEYFNVGQDTRHTLDETIEWGDVDYSIGGKLDSSMDLDIARAFWGYSFVKDARKELGAGIGLHYMNLAVDLRGDGSVDGVPVFDFETGIDDWAILPNVGAYGNYAFSDKWIAIARVDWISASVGDYEGGLWNAEAALQYQAFAHFGIGVSYRYLSFDLSASKNRGDWEADLQYSGPTVFFTTNF